MAQLINVPHHGTVSFPDDMSEADIVSAIKKNSMSYAKDDKVIGSDIPRQLGLATRYGIEGLADTAGIFSDPLAVTSNHLLGTNFNKLRNATSNVLDTIGLPKPQTAQERVVGDASRMLSGTGGLIKGASAASNYLPKAASAVTDAIQARAGLQSASSIGAGYSGGTARENGEGFGGQLGASLLGGILAPLSVAGLSGIATSAGNSIKNTFAPQAIELQIDNVLGKSGVDLSKLHGGIVNSIRDDVRNALSTGQEVSPDALRRLIDYKAVGAVPMRSNLTLNPSDITRDKNIAKLGANSTDPVAQKLAMLQNQNNTTLIDGLNTLGANGADDMYGAGNKVISALQARDNSAKGIINSLYSDAKASNGRSANLDPHAFTNLANDALDFHLVGGQLPADVRNKINQISTGEMPFNVDTSEQLKTVIGTLQRGSSDGSVRKSLGLVRDALENTPLLDNQGQQAINAFNKARGFNRAYMGLVEKTPALQAVRDGIEPDKFVDQFIISNGSKSSVMDVAMLKKNLKGNAEAMDAIRGQIMSSLKSKATSGAKDEVANFSPSAYNKALNAIGDRKLNLFFSQPEIEQMKRIGRVSSYENVQPKGSAVNNSNTASTVAGHALDWINSYLPMGKAVIGDPVQNVKLSLGARNSINAPNALRLPAPKQKLPIPLFPLLGGGLLSAE